MDLDLVPITLFLVIGAVLVAYFYFRYRSRLEVQQTLRAAMERGQELTPELMEAIGGETSSGPADLRRGMLWLALAAAVAVMAWVVETWELLGPAAFPLMLGLAYLILWRLNAGRKT
jgi:hypothetical protein